MRDDAGCEEQLSLERFAGLCFNADLKLPVMLDSARRCRGDFPAAGR